MKTSTHALTIWTDEPRRTGLAWFSSNLGRLIRQFHVGLLSRFISLLGEVSTPGMKPIGFLQAWALRRMGARCDSNEVWIGSHVCFEYPHHVVFGKRVVLGADSRLTARSEIVLGDDFLSAPGLYINTGTHDPVTLVPQSSPVHIGAGVWCGTRVTICAGVNIGDNAVIGASSLVLHDLPPRHLAVGTPCKPCRLLPEPDQAITRWSNFRARGRSS